MRVMSNLPDYVTAIAQRVAARMADARLSRGAAVLTTRQAAVQAVMASEVGTNPAVYFVQIHGAFVHRYARIAPGHPCPTGTTVMFTIDTETHAILDLGISNQTVDLSPLGTVIALTGLRGG
jgi:hypothetical protein